MSHGAIQAIIILLLHRAALLFSIFALSGNTLAEALAEQALCPQSLPPGDTASLPQPLDNTSNQTIISADDSRIEGDIFSLDGNVHITDRDKRISADHIDYNRATGETDLKGNLSLSSRAFHVTAKEGKANTQKNTASFTDLNYFLTRFSGRGKAQLAHIKGKQVATLHDVTYSTCPERRQDWVLKAGKIKIDQGNEVGQARDVSIWFKGVPLMYLPQLSFPTGDKRKSGFLNPRIGQSSKTGTEIIVPWYWNIAPQRDATFEIQHLSDRGTKLNTEYRHLHRNGNTHFEFDNLNDKKRGDDRFRAVLLHHSDLGRNWEVRTNLNHASDEDYFDDLGEGLENSNITHLPREIEFRRDLPLGYTNIRLHEYQVFNVANTYQRLPQIGLDLATDALQGSVQFSLLGELTRFDHRDDIIKGTRLDLSPGIAYEWRDSAYYVRPGLRARHTRYALTNTTPAQEKTLTRTTPILSFDSGLFLERPLELWGSTQTLSLEPRLFYLYTSFENQDAIPIFDTTSPDFRFDELFRHNRFTGPDRQADANQLTLALSSRLIDNDSNRERLRLSIGQTLYFENRRVGLPGNPPAAGNSSDLTGEIEGQFTDTSHFRISGIWNNDTSEVDKATLSYGYREDDKHYANISYRYQRGLFEQTTLAGRWRFGRHWNALGGWTYSLRDEHTNELALALEYDTCCWALQIGAREYLNSSGTEKDSSVYIQLNLKGMSSIGGSIRDFSDRQLNYRMERTVEP